MSNAHTKPMNQWEIEDHILDLMGETGTGRPTVEDKGRPTPWGSKGVP